MNIFDMKYRFRLGFLIIKLLAISIGLFLPILELAAKEKFEAKDTRIAVDFKSKWKLIKHGDNPPTKFSHLGDAIRLQSDQAVAFYTHRLPRLSRISHCDWHLDFEWRVLKATNLSSQVDKGKDDRPLAVHLWVNDASQFGWFKGGLAKLFSIPTPGYMLTYSWGLASEWQTRFANPHLPEKAEIRVLRQETEVGPSWFSESLNISEDLSKLSSTSLIKKPLYLAVSADTEDNNGTATAEIRKMSLWHERCPE